MNTLFKSLLASVLSITALAAPSLASAQVVRRPVVVAPRRPAVVVAPRRPVVVVAPRRPVVVVPRRPVLVVR